MRPLTHREWERHFTQLRPHILAAWPQVNRQDLEVAGDDFNALVALIHDSTGESADLVRQQLKKLDVDELGLGTGEIDEDEEGNASLEQLRLGQGFTDRDRDRVVSRLDKLNRRLKKFSAESTELELSVKERGTSQQKVTLEAWLPKFPKIVATSTEQDLQDALADVREDLWRQIDDAVNKRKVNG